MKDGWLNNTRFDGLTYEVSEPFAPSEELEGVELARGNVVLTIQTAHGKTIKYSVSPNGELSYRGLIDSIWVPDGWDYLGEDSCYFQSWLHKPSGKIIYNFAGRGPVMSLELEIPDTSCIATAMLCIQDRLCL